MSDELITVAEMYAADRATIDAGTPGATLMENAGRAVAEEVARRFQRGRVLVLCGPGNNGGDGFVAARHLADWGWPVEVMLLGDRAALKGDAAHAAGLWAGAVAPLDPDGVAGADIVVDALFGAGLSRPLEGAARATVEALRQTNARIVAVDVPSGLDGDSGAVRGAAPEAALTVTFFRAKPGHWLLPGRLHCGELVVRDIGIDDARLDSLKVRLRRNHPRQWAARFPWPRLDGQKYDRGHAVVAGGPAEKSGAARLAARAALRSGAGLVTVVCSPETLPLYAGAQLSVMTAAAATPDRFDAFIADPRRNAVLLGPGQGVDRITRDWVLRTISRRKAAVLDADALTVFADEPERLFSKIDGPCVLTPHEGEFARLFAEHGGEGEAVSGALDKVSRARAAAAISGAVVLLKGPDTVIAAPDGEAVINTDAPATLASAGTGDVLAGMITGLLAQGMTPFNAAAAAAWLHGAAAREIGPGLISEDLVEAVPSALRYLQSVTEVPISNKA